MADYYRATVAVLAWFALAVQYGLTIPLVEGQGPLRAAVVYLSFFTILTNLLAALALTVPLVLPASRAGAFFAHAGVRAAIASYLIVVSSIYFLILRHLWSPQGWQWLADVIVHYAVPLLFVLDWLIFVPHGRLRVGQAPAWLIFPAAYGAWTFVHGALTGFYPYPFIDAIELGYGPVLTNIAGFVVLFLAVGLCLIGLDRLIAVRLARQTG